MLSPNPMNEEVQYANKSLKNKHVVIGLVYSHSCIHCVHLQPVWKRMKSNIHKKVKAGRYIKPYYLEVEHANMQKLDRFNEKHISEMGGEKIVAEGYPTCFKIVAGVVEYYKGNREHSEMENWFMQNSQRAPIRFSAIVVKKTMKNNTKNNMKNLKHRKTMRTRNASQYRVKSIKSIKSKN